MHDRDFVDFELADAQPVDAGFPQVHAADGEPANGECAYRDGPDGQRADGEGSGGKRTGRSGT
ncbi:hypothetical protein [Alteraurantiacibacter aquimixticola]|uniref:hypothetical protein n=1 Tax=Alteraurantiacibacter aquimixticola TaxID=2489173 RepID=UPI00145B5E09|nr:hypothetical protein [Alteraurantiacibacter aquimixticola]